MKINVLTLFPDMFDAMKHSVVGKAIENEKLNLNVIDFRKFTKDKQMHVDDAPYGGGPGMVLQVQPIASALSEIEDKQKVVILAPTGKPFNQKMATDWANNYNNITFICGHYEGFDQRVYQYATDVVSIGDFILTGGEIPTMAMIDSTVRLIPGVLGNEDSASDESFSDGLLEYPQYTRPAEFEGQKVPDVLLSGHHANIKSWREKQSLKNTYLYRPDLIENKTLNLRQHQLLQEIKQELAKQS
ncbi:tRNA (guanosine(37)-N1)-methyltransferase TrmD [Holzapfeliella floricola]|uniref:tRNA (guanine-N(1)-)-methyltransferase n=1 Tax=Holzapfeliella floricola DSM 23037 = JCM 16512 TaxID=1423744 RepID=A0A0R2DTN6_9LACO|nr:tRNA (guanosine(37)-N1)-methyltransferase TrmD [Holzapfeliella floricola]KRN03818.1 tRNA (guanine-N1)-methyltransferase [Holzapfeliella floricola DSM 23037 = JCM 16512]